MNDDLLGFINSRPVRPWLPDPDGRPPALPTVKEGLALLPALRVSSRAAANLHVQLWKAYRPRYAKAIRSGSTVGAHEEAMFAWGGYLLHLLLWGALAPPSPVILGASRWDPRDIGALIADARRVLRGPGMDLAAKLRGSGWVVIAYDTVDQQVRALELPDHDLDRLGTGWPLLALDCWEHSWVCDRGAQGRKQWLLDYVWAINWDVIEFRLREALDAAG